MLFKRKTLTGGLTLFLLLIFAFAAAPLATSAKSGNEAKAIVRHLKTKYRAKKVRIPLMWLAKFAVSVARPAGVKSFNITLFEDLKFSSSNTLDAEMQAAMRNSLSEEWSPILRVRSREGEQVYMYMREVGNNNSVVKIMLVSIDKNNAAVVRATFSPDKLVEFMNNPKVFGISLENKNEQTTDKTPEKNNSVTNEKKDEPKQN